MKHSLKITAALLLLVATAFLVVTMTSASDDGVLVLPVILVATIVSGGLMEVDRRLNMLEQNQSDT